MDEDDEKVYRTFRNKFKFKAKDLEAKLISESYLYEMPNFNNVSEQLIEHVKGYRNDDKFDPILVYDTLVQLLKREPQYIEKIVSEISDKPEVSIRTLVLIEEGVEQYWPEVFSKLEDEPIAVMDFARRHGNINNPQLVDYAINRSKDLPKTTHFGLPVTFSGNYFHQKHWMDSIDVLVDMSLNSQEARQAVLNVLETPWWYIVTDIVNKKENIDPVLIESIKEYLIEKLQKIIPKDIEFNNVEIDSKEYRRLFYNYGRDGYRICQTLATIGNLSALELDIVKNALITSPNEITITGCLLPFSSINSVDINITSMLEKFLDVDWEKELDEGRYLAGKARLTSGFNYSIIQTAPQRAMSLVPYYAAAALIKHNPEHKKAISVIKKYQNSELPLSKKIQYRFFKTNPYISYFYDDQNYYTFEAEFSPIEVLANQYKANSNEWINIVLDGLNSEKEVHNLNAAQLIEKNETPISEEIKNILIKKAKQKPTDPKSHVFLNALKKHFPNDPEIQNIRATRYNHTREERHFEIFNL